MSEQDSPLVPEKPELSKSQQRRKQATEKPKKQVMIALCPFGGCGMPFDSGCGHSKNVEPYMIAKEEE